MRVICLLQQIWSLAMKGKWRRRYQQHVGEREWCNSVLLIQTFTRPRKRKVRNELGEWYVIWPTGMLHSSRVSQTCCATLTTGSIQKSLKDVLLNMGNQKVKKISQEQAQHWAPWLHHTYCFIVSDMSRPKRIIKRPKHYNSDEFGRGYDPFRLVPVDYYSDEDPAPFRVEITSDALVCANFVCLYLGNQSMLY